MKRYYSFETSNENIINGLRRFLKENNIYYEASSTGYGLHFEIKASENELQAVNNYLDTLYKEVK